MLASFLFLKSNVRTGVASFLLLGLSVVSVGCGLPRDPEGSIERIRGGVLRVGVAENSPLTKISDKGAVSGEEADMVKELATDLNAQVTWVEGGESELMGKLESYELDLVIGGIPSDTPWKQQVALTDPYDPLDMSDPTEMPHVLALPPGENRWLYELQRWLNERLQKRAATERTVGDSAGGSR